MTTVEANQASTEQTLSINISKITYRTGNQKNHQINLIFLKFERHIK